MEDNHLRQNRKTFIFRGLLICISIGLLIIAIGIKNVNQDSSNSIVNAFANNEESFDDQVDKNDVVTDDDQVDKNDVVTDNDQVDKDDVVTDDSQASNEDKKVAYLTFDDGPDNISDELLDLLNEFDAKATFFMMEPRMKEHPKEVQRMVDEGHGVGLHGVTHDAAEFYGSSQSLLNELNKGNQTLKDITGIDTVLIRTPYGSVPYMTEEYRETVKNNGFKMWDWHVDSADWEIKGPGYVPKTISQIEDWNQDVVILLHEQNTTVQYLGELLDYLTENNFDLEKLDGTMQPFQFKVQS